MTSHSLHTMDDLTACAERIDTEIDSLKQTMKDCEARKKELQDMLTWANHFQTNEPVVAKLNTIHFKGARERYAKEHERAIDLYRLAKRKLSVCADLTKPLPVGEWEREMAAQERMSHKAYEKFTPLRDQADMLWKIKYRVQKVLEEEDKGKMRDTRRDERDEGR